VVHFFLWCAHAALGFSWRKDICSLLLIQTKENAAYFKPIAESLGSKASLKTSNVALDTSKVIAPANIWIQASNSDDHTRVEG
jgi:hypothetical protein